ncbi:MAG: hypothetical protein AAF982_08440 [Pseudomonadota bacterium]
MPILSEPRSDPSGQISTAQTGVNAQTLGIGFGKGAHTGLLGFGDDLTLAALVERALDATLSSGLNAAVHRSKFRQGFSPPV